MVFESASSRPAGVMTMRILSKVVPSGAAAALTAISFTASSALARSMFEAAAEAVTPGMVMAAGSGLEMGLAQSLKSSVQPVKAAAMSIIPPNNICFFIQFLIFKC